MIFIILGIVLFLLLVYVINCCIVYKIIIRRNKEIPLVDLDLSKTQYKDFENEVRDYTSFFNNIKPEIVEIKSYDNLILKGYYYKNTSNDFVIMFHGYRATPLNNFAVMGKKLYEKGYNLLMIVERSHGISEGKDITFGIKESIDSHSWIEFVNNTYKPNNIFLYGVSMGSAVILLNKSLNEEKNVRCVIADCPLDRSKHAITLGLKRKMKFIPYLTVFGVLAIARLKGISFKNDKVYENVKNINVPILFIHGRSDDLIPIENGRRVFENANEPKKMIETEALHAMSIYYQLDFVSNEIMDFIKKYTIN